MLAGVDKDVGGAFRKFRLDRRPLVQSLWQRAWPATFLRVAGPPPTISKYEATSAGQHS
jgi:hypothetical protein